MPGRPAAGRGGDGCQRVNPGKAYPGLDPGREPVLGKGHAPNRTKSGTIPLLVRRAERDPADPAVADQRDPPFGRAVGEMRCVDVAAERGNAAEGYRAQRAELRQDRLIEL